jgi:dTDP-4-dehydrorhamnose 3,5-epimerase
MPYTSSPPPLEDAQQNHLSLLQELQSPASLTATWDPLKPPDIHGVLIRDVKNVVYSKGALTELFRSEWFDAAPFDVRHVTLVSLLPGQTTQWHRHRQQRDVVFPIVGTIRIGLFDPRADSPTLGKGMVVTFNLLRPRWLYIPPGVWHALRNVGAEDASYIVLNDTMFDYAAPDDWVLPAGSELIPVSLD